MAKLPSFATVNHISAEPRNTSESQDQRGLVSVPKSRSARAVEEYFTRLSMLRSTGGATAETSLYSALESLLNSIGSDLKPAVFCLSQLADQGAGHPDFGLFAATQCQKGEPKPGQIPERGVVEVKSPADDTWFTAQTKQVSTYWHHYRLVLVTNYRDFLLIGEDANGNATKLESFRLANSESEFWSRVQTPRRYAQEIADGLGEYLHRVLTRTISLRHPKDVAWILASYARDALDRVEENREVSALETVRTALETALGVEFEGTKGRHFFHSTLVQTLFYGVFSAWVLWARLSPPQGSGFEWRSAVWHLRVPMLQALFQSVSNPKSMKALDLVEILDWTADALNRVDRKEFFSRFNDAEAVQYFYEPFLEAFDPELRKELGVWYTPSEIVRYMVARVDRALKDDLGIADGLAADNVFVLDPCTGTGSFIAEVLRCIAGQMDDKGLGALKGAAVRRAATERIFGFEIMPAPFVVAHLQTGLVLNALHAPLPEDGTQRVGIHLTNALAGWEPTGEERQLVAFPEMAEERDRANEIKRNQPILVIIGNPPYNGFAGMAMAEERALSDAYRTTTGNLRKPEGQGLNDLYVRFFRMAERRIVEKTGQGIVSFISNSSWLDGMSFPGMRQRYLQVFDSIRIDSLNGDKYKTGKTAPDGSPDPSIFSTEQNREGIQVGTAITTLVRKPDHMASSEIEIRQLWGTKKREELLATASADPQDMYQRVSPLHAIGLPFLQIHVDDAYFGWHTLPELLPVSFSGVKTARDEFLVDVDLDRLQQRVSVYFDQSVPDEEIRRLYPAVMKDGPRFDAPESRRTLTRRGVEYGSFVRYAYRPFDVRWLYWDPDTKLLDEKRAEYWPHVFEGNYWVTAARALRKGEAEAQHAVLTQIGSYHLIERASLFFPAYIRDEHDHGNRAEVLRRANVTASIATRLAELDLGVEDLFHHIVAILHCPAYRSANSTALGMDWPRVPFPKVRNAIVDSSALGRALATLLNPEQPVPAVTTGGLRAELKMIGLPSRSDGQELTETDFAVTAGWGSVQRSGIVMPGRGQAQERDYGPEETRALAAGSGLLGLSITQMQFALGESTFDVYLNDYAYWSNVPANVWGYKLGGYQVVKKWLSYRELDVLGRPLRFDEIQEVMHMIRRIASILLLGPSLDDNYLKVKACST